MIFNGHSKKWSDDQGGEENPPINIHSELLLEISQHRTRVCGYRIAAGVGMIKKGVGEINVFSLFSSMVTFFHF